MTRFNRCQKTSFWCDEGVFTSESTFPSITYSRLMPKSEVWKAWNKWKNDLENSKELHEVQRQDWKKHLHLAWMIETLKDWLTKETRCNRVERLWSFKGLNLTVHNADGQTWNEDDKKNEMLSYSIQLYEEWKVKRDKRVKESRKTNPVWYKHLM